MTCTHKVPLATPRRRSAPTYAKGRIEKGAEKARTVFERELALEEDEEPAEGEEHRVGVDVGQVPRQLRVKQPHLRLGGRRWGGGGLRPTSSTVYSAYTLPSRWSQLRPPLPH